MSNHLVHAFVEYLNKIVNIDNIIIKYQGCIDKTDSNVNKSKFSALQTAISNIRQGQLNLNLALENIKEKQSESLSRAELLLAQQNNIDENEVNFIAKQNEDFIKMISDLQTIRAEQHEELQLLLAECD